MLLFCLKIMRNLDRNPQESAKKKFERHYFTRRPDTKPKKIIIKTVIKGIPFKFYSSTCIFSKCHVDRASQLLIEKGIAFGDVLDFGCGYGAIGIAMKVFNPDINLHMSDLNERALQLARRNAVINSVPASIKKGAYLDCWKERTFDVILLNPPMSAGRDVCFRMIEEAYLHLKENGILEVVSFHNKGGQMIEQKILEIFNNVKTIAKSGGARIYAGKKTDEITTLDR